jgi:2-polyprenyl-6-methoxyphenol hydroxylase-like FAD-dependent oxidoreductase
MHKTPVVIVGGGPVGLSLACELGWRGIACTLVEQGDGTIGTPKMNEVSIRTMEFCRRWGIADAVHASPFPADYPLDVAFVTSLSGYELGRIARPPRMNEAPDPHSPMRRQVCSQLWFDPILQGFARSFPHVTLRYRTRLDEFEQTDSTVRAKITDLQTGQSAVISAEFLIGCDGANSTVRRALGIDLSGVTLGHAVHMYFRAPNLLEKCGRNPATFFFIVDQQGVWSNIRFIDPAREMWRLTLIDTGAKIAPATIDRETHLHRALGFSLPVEWLDTSVWTRRSMVAAHYAHGRVLLAGDAVHQLSPTGGLGMNTGIADAIDLGWKLAAKLDGWGGEALLRSYEFERRPIGVRATQMATEFHLDQEKISEELALIGEDDSAGAKARQHVGVALVRDVGRQFRTTGLQIGYRYEDSPICIRDGTPPYPDHPDHFIASTRPGSRAPHVWLDDGRSTLDLFGRGFVLLRLGINPPDCSAIEDAAAARHVPLQTITLIQPDAAQLYERRLVLVRPDGQVAWRADEMPPDAGAVIDRARGTTA